MRLVSASDRECRGSPVPEMSRIDQKRKPEG